MGQTIQIQKAQLHKGLEYLSEDMSFTAVLRRHCEKNGNAHYDLVAAAAHLDAAYVYRLIKGDKSHPSSNTVIRLALALHLTVSETDELLMAAGYAPLVIPGNEVRNRERSQALG